MSSLESDFGKIVPAFKGNSSKLSALYCQAVADALKIHFSEIASQYPSTPWIRWDIEDDRQISIFFLAKRRNGAFKFFLDLISRWLIPGKFLEVVFICASDFRLPDLYSEDFTLCELKLELATDEDVEQAKINLPLLKAELKLGISSAIHARRILDAKGLTLDQKVADIQQKTAMFIRRKPQLFESGLLQSMQRVLGALEDSFKKVRTSTFLTRLITSYYLLAKKDAPFLVKTFHRPSSFANCAGLLLVRKGAENKTPLQLKGILQAVESVIPDVEPIPHSFQNIWLGTNREDASYVEYKKRDSSPFTLEELRKLKKDLPAHLNSMQEPLIHPVFMPRNEEEILRNMMSLSSEIQFHTDPPQLMVSFEEQTYFELVFNIILVRIVTPGFPSIQQLFLDNHSTMEYVQDRCKTLGYLKKKYIKEATVFRLKLTKAPYLRKDNTVDLNRARQDVVHELVRFAGEVRDFNGGMILKQNEALNILKEDVFAETEKALGGEADLFLDNFFYSLEPGVMRALLPSEAIAKLLRMILSVKSMSTPEVVSLREDPYTYIVIPGKSRDDFQKLQDLAKTLSDTGSGHEVLTSLVTRQEKLFFGVILCGQDADTQKELLELIKN